jgi:hypothetical protein
MAASIDILEKEAREDLEFDETTAHLYSIKLGAIKLKWLKYLYEESLLLEEYRGMVDSMFKKIYVKLKYDSEQIYEKKDLDIIVSGDEKYIEAKKLLNKQGQKVKFIEDMMKVLENQSFLLNNLTKLLLYKSGA